MQDILEEMGCTLREYAWPDYWYFGKERRMMGSAEKASVFEPLSHQSDTALKLVDVYFHLCAQFYFEQTKQHLVISYISTHGLPCMLRMHLRLRWRTSKLVF